MSVHLDRLHAVEREMRDWANELGHVAALLGELGLERPAKPLDVVIASIERHGSELSASYVNEIVARTQQSDRATGEFVLAMVRNLSAKT